MKNQTYIKIKFPHILVWICFCIAPLYSQQISINEIMSSNQSVLFDQDGDSSDWIELYNHGSEGINLGNYSLSDDGGQLTKWGLPDTIIPPQSTVLIFASGKDKITNNEIHTNFKLSASGESIYLVENSSKVIVSYIDPINLGEDNSYGRLPDGTDNLMHLDYSTPNSSNNNTSQLVFSHQSGYFNSDFNLNIISLLGDTVYYSLDSSIPTNNSEMLQDVIYIYNNSTENNYFSEFPTTPEQEYISYKAWESPSEKIDKAIVVRAVSYKNGEPSSRIYTKTYFVNENDQIKYDLPIISLVTESRNLFDPNIGIYTPGVHFNNTDPEWSGNYFQKGHKWERPIHVEYFNQEGILKFNQNAGVRIHGGKTRQAAQKSLRLYARTEYGNKYFNYNLLPTRSNNIYKNFILRTSMGDWNESIITDVVAHHILNDSDIETMHFQPVIVFLNGEYWGIHTIRDYINEDYISYDQNIEKDSVDLITWDSSENLDYNNLIEYLENNDLGEQSNYEYIETKIDVENYITYQISQMFFANADWPANNVKLWKQKSEDGKWRWIFYDLDGGIGDYTKNMFLHCTNVDENVYWPNSPSSTFLFRNFLKNSDFITRFIVQVSEMLQSTFSTNSTVLKTLNIKELYRSSIQQHIGRWGFPKSKEIWENEDVNEVIDFLHMRPCEFENNLINFLSPTIFESSCVSDFIESRLSIFPCPNNGNFQIINHSSDFIEGEIFILNTQGQIIYKNPSVSLVGYANLHFYLPTLRPGLYMLSYRHNLEHEILKFIIGY